MRWWNRYNFPYSNFHDLNLDWIIKEMNRLIEEWEQLKAEWEQMKIEWAEFKAEMQRLWQEYKDLMNAAWEAYKAQMNQEWADYKDEMDAAWDAYQAELNAQWTAYQNNLNAAWLAYQNAMNTWKDGVDQDIQDKFDEIDEKCRQCKADVDAALANLATVLAQVQQQVTDYLANLPYQTIIRDTTNDWLDEHGVTIPVNYLTPEDFGAVGDGVTDDTNAFSALATAANEQNKPILLKRNTTYKTGIFRLRGSAIVEGNNATLDMDLGAPPVVDGLLYIGGPNTIIRNLKLINNESINGLNADISGLVLDNVTCGSLALSYSVSGVTNNVIIRNVTCTNNNDQSLIGHSDRPIANLVIDGLKLNNMDSGAHHIYTVDAFIRGANGYGANSTVPVNISTSGEVMIESYINVNFTQTGQAGTVYTGTVYTASYSSL